jgi:hypothetical protein
MFNGASDYLRDNHCLNGFISIAIQIALLPIDDYLSLSIRFPEVTLISVLDKIGIHRRMI